MYYYTCGKGTINLVLLHGWALNAEIWNEIVPCLSANFCLHIFDLPGYGRSQNLSALTLNDMAIQLLPFIPYQSILIGWSLGGLVAMKLALIKPEVLGGIITVASSPRFIAAKSWPGIKLNVFKNFQFHIQKDLQKTIDRFLLLQTLGSNRSYFDVLTLKKAIFSQPITPAEVLNNGLKILTETDMRTKLPLIKIPFLRIYGYLDNLVPRCISPILDKIVSLSNSIIMEKAAHAPFISHPDKFCKYITDFIKKIDF
ncbi:pimeloyl-[acyl-carrier protein] methyl ester esterase [Candidatus Pantoea edessiphila]|uniref:Pimeloyl-[acyl-carrier protein] methyl ester esterase n=1 Tax=Candidatus Pantoea edessiphila TaxID=2044610 RepID=A0A2P5T1W1_9GAMM|nr:pimeloyl-ACP methyl ester esterase BioH [Candidatus Pantoea edessiphila]PPI88530.1 pimeloyl-[acyl-carrier protein] methyl ester esterase [Candidatus Pantoea edessiphila]